MANKKPSRRDFLRTSGVPIAAGLSGLPLLAKPEPMLSSNAGGVPQSSSSAYPIEVESGCHPAIRVQEATLFPFDDYSIPFTWGLRRQLIMGKRFGPPNPVVVHLGGPGEPDNVKIQYYGTVIQIGDELRMWYLGQGDKATFDPPGMLPMYATSKDGLHWEKPKLGLVTYNGNKQNNLIDLCGGQYRFAEYVIIHDPEDPDPSRRFKCVFESRKYRTRLAVAYSADGLTWKESPLNPVGYSLEESGLIKFNGCYYVNGQGGGQWGAGRKMQTFASYDFEHWTRGSVLSFRRGPVVERRQETDNTFEEVHLGASLMNKGNVILGMYGMWHGIPGGDRQYITMDLGLVVSNDGMHFREPIPDFPMMPSFEESELSVNNRAPSVCQGQGMANIGDKTLYWYEAWGTGLVRVATWERDRLGFFNAYDEDSTGSADAPVAELISCPMKLGPEGGAIFVNASGLSDKAELTFEILDREFHPVPGYTAKECIPNRVSGFRQAVTWKGNGRLQAFSHPIRIRAVFGGDRPSKIKLYAIYLTSK
jgi:hypothetical protein